MNFEFATAARILFGPGKFREAPALAGSFGKRTLLIMAQGLPHQVPAAVSMQVAGEPTFDLVRRAVKLGRDNACDVVVAIGGGSAMDAGKSVSMLLANGGDPLDYAEVIGAGRPITRPSVPFIAIPTTAGTGTEVTRNAVLASPEHRVKVSLRSPLMLPAVALVDPTLTHDMPPELTAATGMDALSQLIEPFVSRRANAMTDALCREALPRVARSLYRAYQDGRDAGAREDMSFGSLCGGLALANAGLGAVHGFAAPIGGMFDAPHGAVCAALLPHVFEVNHRALAERGTRSEMLDRFDLVADLLLNQPQTPVRDACYWLKQLSQNLRIPRLSSYGIKPAHLPEIIEKASAASSMKANPIELTRDELREILEKSC
jgi:alcohol dehydrogenase class IV